MKSSLIIFSIIISIIFSSLLSKSQDSIIGLEFNNHKEVEYLSAYLKVSDTTVLNSEVSFDAQHSLLHLRNTTNNLILFSSITRDKDEKRRYKIIDTLIIPKVKKQEFITIGYCEMGSSSDVSLIGIVNKTNSLKVRNINKIWKINIKTNKIEKLEDLNDIECWNEFYNQ